jgi:hypothetical protein
LKTSLLVLLVAVATSIVAIGCGGGSGDGDETLSCEVSNAGAVQDCSLYTGVPSSGVAGLKQGCTASGISTVGTSCPTDGVLATCTSKAISGSNLKEVESTYTQGGVSALMTQCANEGGTFESVGS